MVKDEYKNAKPFLKWAGGKTQLIHIIAQTLPHKLYSSRFTYIEPFVGSGALLFWVINNFPKLKKAVINDINEDLVNSFKVIADNPNELISFLEILQREYHDLEGRDEVKKEYYYRIRNSFNKREEERVVHAAFFIFLNRTCFNGLYRVNKSNAFNVPIGSYKRPTICDRENISLVSKALQKVEIMCGDFEATIHKADNNSFFYFDPPYKPLSNTSSFNSYSKYDFNDLEQIRLKEFCAKLSVLGHNWMLSNSDVKSNDSKNNFFDDMYSGYSISRVRARRSINANPDKRGELNELLITNYINEKALQSA